MPMSFAVGLIFVVRDYAQRAVGHWVIAAMLAAGVLSWWMADPFVALASVAAFAVSSLSSLLRRAAVLACSDGAGARRSS